MTPHARLVCLGLTLLLAGCGERLPYKTAPQIEWYADHGGLVLLKTQPGVVQNDVTPGGGQ